MRNWPENPPDCRFIKVKYRNVDYCLTPESHSICGCGFEFNGRYFCEREKREMLGWGKGESPPAYTSKKLSEAV